MFSSSKPNYLKLRTNLRLCINRLKLLEKKKTELALKARKEIADYVAAGKEDRARIRVEHIIREDYLVEAMEIVEMLCDLLLARFGLIEKMAQLDPGIEEAVATIIWAAPRMSADIQELQEVSHQLALKYGKEYAGLCRGNNVDGYAVNEKVIHKMSLSAPPKILIESYLMEISKTYKVPFEPDPVIMMGEPPAVSNLIDLRLDSFVTNGSGVAGSAATNQTAPSAAELKRREAENPGGRSDEKKRPPSPPSGGGGGGGGGIPVWGTATGGACEHSGGGGVNGDTPRYTDQQNTCFQGGPPQGGFGVGARGGPSHQDPMMYENNYYVGIYDYDQNDPVLQMEGQRRNQQPPSMTGPPSYGGHNPMNYQNNWIGGEDNMPSLPAYEAVANLPAQYPVVQPQPFVQPQPVAPPRNRIDQSVQPPPGAPTPVAPPRSKVSSDTSNVLNLPDLPSVPTGGSVGVAGGEDVNFDDLTRRFEELKKRK